jgi:peptidoglycan/LPS O-acetylase OafA/YrhL
MLVRLTESDVRIVADDARAVLADGLRKDWFGDRKPFYQDLIALASRTEGGRKSGASARLILALVAGMLALVLGVFFFLQQSQPDVEMPILAVAVGILIVVLAGAMALKQ